MLTGLLVNYGHYFLAIVTIWIWNTIFPVKFNHITGYSELFVGLYSLITFIGYDIIKQLEIRILNIGMILTFWGLLINFLASLSGRAPSPAGHAVSLTGIIIISLGFKKAVKNYRSNITRIKHLSFHDHLTGLYNRRYFENELTRLDSSRKLPISIIVIDLDNLKEINDTLGHRKGDEYIKRAADIISSVTRQEDIVARVGGDEFAILLPRTPLKTARNFCRRLYEKCEEYKNKEQCSRLSLSCGYATKNNSQISLEQTFVRADKNMYLEKK